MGTYLNWVTATVAAVSVISWAQLAAAEASVRLRIGHADPIAYETPKVW